MPSTKCPKCGAPIISNNELYQSFECATNITQGVVNQSNHCLIKELRAKLEKAKEALRLFDKNLKDWESDWGGPVEFAAVKDQATRQISLGDLRKASALLTTLE